MLRDRQAAEDAVQETAAKAWRYRGRIRPELGTIRPWVLAILANECRLAKRGRWWSVIRGVPIVTVEREKDFATSFDLRRAIEQLSDTERMLLHLYFVLDLPQEEVASVLGISVGAVKSRLQRVTARLRSTLIPEVVQ